MSSPAADSTASHGNPSPRDQAPLYKTEEFRFLLPTVLILSLLTGTVVGQLIQIGKSGSTVGPALVVATTETTAREFYAAINHYLDTGESRLVFEKLSPSYADHGLDPAKGDSRTELLELLRSIRAAEPEHRYEVAEVVAGVDQAVVWFKSKSLPIREVQNLEIEPQSDAGRFDRLRISGDVVEERWPAGSTPALIDPVLTDIELSGETIDLNIELLRVSLGPREAMSAHSEFPTLLIPESSGLMMAEETKSEEMSSRYYFVDPDTRWEVWNPGTASASLLQLRIGRHMHLPGSTYQQNFEPVHDDNHLLAYVLSYRLAGGMCTISASRLTLPPGAALTLHEVSGSEIVFVESGSLHVDPHEAAIFESSVRGTTVYGREPIFATGGTAVAADASANISYENSGSHPTSFWFISVNPCE